MAGPPVSFEFATAARIIFGCGAVSQVGAIAADLGRVALVVTGRSLARAAGVLQSLHSAGVRTATFATSGEPSIERALDGVRAARAAQAEIIVGVGGGSAIDMAKAIAALSTNAGDPFDYLEVVGRGQSLTAASLPVIAVPTTAGTGSEVTRNAVLSSPQHRVKVSLRSVTMLPRVALVDPELALDLPPTITATTGLDALTQLIEPYVSSKANPMVDELCRGGIRRAATALPLVFANGLDAAARSDMAVASLWSGMALANAGLGAVHGLAGPLGGMFGAPHGALCAALLPHVMDVNLAALRQAGESHFVSRYDEVARLVTGQDSAVADDGVEAVAELVRRLAIPGLASWGIGPDDLDAVVEPARRASSMKANPIPLNADQLRTILQRAL